MIFGGKYGSARGAPCQPLGGDGGVSRSAAGAGQVKVSTWQPVNKGDSGGGGMVGEGGANPADWRSSKGSIYCGVTPFAGG